MVKISIQGIEFGYNSTPLLKNINLNIDKGEVMGLIGPNGSGKSTLLRCIEGILKYKKGCILIDEKELQKMHRKEIAKHIGYVPQSQPQVFPSTVFDTILMGRYPHSSWKASEHDYEVVSKVIEILNIRDFALRDINSLSGGEMQKVFIGRAIAQETDVLLLDEPTSNLDLRHQLEVLKIIKSLAKEKGCTAIVTMHDLNLAARYFDNIAMLKNGKLHAIGKTEEVITKENIKAVYGVEVEILKNRNGISVFPISVV